VARDGRIRIFCALRLPAPTLDSLVAWQETHLPTGRLVARENLHVTLAFLGHRPQVELAGILGALRDAAARAEPPLLDDESERAEALARDLHSRLEALGVYEPERRRWLPHVTVLRFRERPRLRPALPDLEPFAPSDAAVYLSRLRPGGAQYEVLESVALGGR